MRPISCTLGLIFLATQIAAQPRDDLPVNVLPRTPEETARIAAVTAPSVDFTRPEPFETLPGGATTVPRRATPDALAQPAANLTATAALDFTLGHALFTRTWVSSPASTLASDGLGPLFNARACDSCHLNSARGLPRLEDTPAAPGLLLRLSVPAQSGPADIEGWIATAPEPTYGGQLQDLALPGHAAEAAITLHWHDTTVRLADGTEVTLRRPDYGLSTPSDGPFHPQTMISPRLAPPMIGLALIDAIPADDIRALADPEDADGDGISGRVAMVHTPETAAPMLGRFGWKAGVATLRDQVARAFAGDLGLSSPLYPAPWGDCTEAQTACRTAPHGEDPAQDGFELSATGLDLVTLYAGALAVPARQSPEDPQVLRGKALFYDIGCIACHRPKFVTHRLNAPSAASFQLIWPYSDFLLHDMGAGLADNRPEGRATGREWRTPPLWGIGLTEITAGQGAFLHDGRARTLLEAILWHGGEAAPHQRAVVALSQTDRNALIAFLESL